MAVFNAPRLLKGALVSLDPPNPTPQVIVFQYNPNTLTRTLEAQVAEDEGKSSSPPRLKGAPVETIKIDVEIDAADQLERGDANAADVGVFPQLSALELLIYPKSDLVMTNAQLLKAGTLEIMPPTASLTLFIWGKRRILPVRLTEFSVTEDAHHPNLSPIRAKVSLGLRVQSYSDVSADNPAWNLFLSHQVLKETMAAVATTTSVSAVVGSNVKLI
jgi:Contractile injection system tube protein